MENILRREWMVKPSECNANRELPLTSLVAQMIELATDHANILGIGFLAMEPRGLGWVLSRLSVEMAKWPKNGEKYILSTWIESYNAHFSDRCFSIENEYGEILGFGRTVWVIIDLKTHKSVGTAGTVMPDDMIASLDCPIPKFSKPKHFVPTDKTEYTFRYTDIDFYRHVNTVKYIALLLNQFTLEEFDTHTLTRFDIAFAHEAKYGETVIIKSMKEKVTAPGMASHLISSERTSFDLTIDEKNILSASIVLSKL